MLSADWNSSLRNFSKVFFYYSPKKEHNFIYPLKQAFFRVKFSKFFIKNRIWDDQHFSEFVVCWMNFKSNFEFLLGNQVFCKYCFSWGKHHGHQNQNFNHFNLLSLHCTFLISYSYLWENVKCPKNNNRTWIFTQFNLKSPIQRIFFCISCAVFQISTWYLL